MVRSAGGTRILREAHGQDALATSPDRTKTDSNHVSFVANAMPPFASVDSALPTHTRPRLILPDKWPRICIAARIAPSEMPALAQLIPSAAKPLKGFVSIPAELRAGKTHPKHTWLRRTGPCTD